MKIPTKQQGWARGYNNPVPEFPSPRASSPRLPSIDLLRALAIAMMVPVHFVMTLGRREALPGISALVAGISSHAAPLFTFLVGVSFSASLGRARKTLAWRRERRALFLFVVGLLLLAVTQEPRDILSWDVLTLIGFSVFFLERVRGVPPVALGGVALFILGLSPWLRTFTHYEEFWKSGEYVPQLNAGQAFLGFWINGEFPVFPWLFFPLVGYLMGRYLFAGPNRRISVPNFVGLCLFFVGILGERSTPASFYPASTSFLLRESGTAVLLLGAAHWALDVRRFLRLPLFIERFSRYSLTLFVVHFVAHIWPMALVGLILKGDVGAYYKNAMSSGSALLLSFIFLLAFAWIIKAWDRHGGKYSLEWIGSRLTGEHSATP